MLTYIARSYADLNKQLATFCSKIDEYVAELNLDPAEVDVIKKDQKLLSYVMNADNAFHTYAEAIASYKELLRNGIADEVLADFPVPPVLAAPIPDITESNLQARFARLIQNCVRSKKFTTNIGEDLAIIKPKTVFDVQSGKPILKIKLTDGGHPRLSWKKGKYPLASVYKDAGTGKGYHLLNKSTRAFYIDKEPLPHAGQSAVWKYKLIYHFGLNEEEVGSFSDEVVVTVYGAV